MNFELNGYKTKELAWKTQVRETEVHKVKALNMYKEAKEDFEVKIKEHLRLQQKFNKLEAENTKTHEAINTLRTRKRKDARRDQHPKDKSPKDQDIT